MQSITMEERTFFRASCSIDSALQHARGKQKPVCEMMIESFRLFVHPVQDLISRWILFNARGMDFIERSLMHLIGRKMKKKAKEKIKD